MVAVSASPRIRRRGQHSRHRGREEHERGRDRRQRPGDRHGAEDGERRRHRTGIEQQPEQRHRPAHGLAGLDHQRQRRGDQCRGEKLPGGELERAQPPDMTPHVQDRDRPHRRRGDEQQIAVDRIAARPVEADRVEHHGEPAEAERQPGRLEPGQPLAEQDYRRRRHPERGDEGKEGRAPGLGEFEAHDRHSRVDPHHQHADRQHRRYVVASRQPQPAQHSQRREHAERGRAHAHAAQPDRRYRAQRDLQQRPVDPPDRQAERQQPVGGAGAERLVRRRCGQ